MTSRRHAQTISPSVRTATSWQTADAGAGRGPPRRRPLNAAPAAPGSGGGRPRNTSRTRSYLTAALSWLPAENFGTVLAGMVTFCPGFRGFTPVRALRFCTVNLPKPVKTTSSPLDSASLIDSSVASTAAVASFLLSPLLLATLSMNSLFVTLVLLRRFGAGIGRAASPYHGCRTATIRLSEPNQAVCGAAPTPSEELVKSEANRTPCAAIASAPPSSRSTTQIAAETCRSASRSASTAESSAPPDVTTSSTTQTCCPA